MLKHSKTLVLSLLSLILLTGCTSGQSNAGSAASEDGYQEAREVAWNYVENQGWSDTLEDETWKTAKVDTIVAPDYYEYIDTSHAGQEVLVVIFEAKENSVASATNFLVDEEMNEVVGFLPGE